MKYVLRIMVGSAVKRWKEDQYTELMNVLNNADKWVAALANQTQKKARVKTDKCEICGSSGELELHHIAGKDYGHWTITVCTACHIKLTSSQKVWYALWCKGNAEKCGDAFFLLGLRDILILKSEVTCNPAYKSLANKFTYYIEELLGRRGADTKA